MSSALIVGATRYGSLESSYQWGLTENGWQVSIWDIQASIDGFARGGAAGRTAGRFLHVEAWVRKANLALFDLVDEARPDLLLVIGTEGVRAGTLAQIKVRVPEIHISCLYPDSPHNLTMDRIQCLPLFDSVLTVSPAWVPPFRHLGAASADYLPLAADTRLHSPQEAPPGGPHADISFIGSWSPDREAFLRELDRSVDIWGDDSWRRHSGTSSTLKASWKGRPVVGREFSSVCANSRIMLNHVHAFVWPGPNMRVFEHAASRAFSLTTRTPAILEIFQEDENIICYESVAEAREKIDHYLPRQSERKRIAAAGHQLVAEKGHTYIERAKTLIGMIART